MSGEITTGKWKTSGISLLWDGAKLGEVCATNQVVSMRNFFQIEQNGWPKDLPSNEGNTLVVSGLDTCIDVLTPDDSITWMEQELYPKLRSFQSEYENQASLIFWMPTGNKRIREVTSQSSFTWIHWNNKEEIPISRCLWNGAEKDSKKIIGPSKVWLGLYHPRIS